MNKEKNKKIILSFDLDNTLINNRDGIVASFNYALNKFNLSELDKSQIEPLIGTPLDEMFAKFSTLDPSTLSSAFREYYGKKGLYQATLLPGIKSKLKELKNLDFTLGIITSKKQELAKKLIEILQMKDYFDFIIGETEDTKKLGKLDPKLTKILKNKYPHHKIIVIGDHPKDVLLSNNLDCPFIGVLTGNHSATQLKEFKSEKIHIINSVSELTTGLINSLI